MVKLVLSGAVKRRITANETTYGRLRFLLCYETSCNFFHEGQWRVSHRHKTLVVHMKAHQILYPLLQGSRDARVAILFALLSWFYLYSLYCPFHLDIKCGSGYIDRLIFCVLSTA